MRLLTKIAPPQFEKRASKFSLSDNPATYASELTAHLYKQHPYLGRYEVNLSIEGQDTSMGYLYGVFTVSPVAQVPPQEMQQRMDMVSRGGEEPASPEETLRIPIIVDNKKAHSFDVFITPEGKFLPLSEERLAGALFSSSPYMVAPKSALTGAQQFSAARNFSPDVPTGASGGGGGFGAPNSSVEKIGSILAKVGSTVGEEEANRVIEKIAVDDWLKTAFKTNPSFHEAVSKITSFKKEAQAPVPEDFSAAVLQKASGGYEVTSTSTKGFKTKVAFIANNEAGAVPLAVRQEVVSSGYCLLSNNTTPLEQVEKTDGLEKVASTGVYAVMSKEGVSERAIVLKDIVTFDGRPTKLAYIVGESGAALQDDVAGIRCGNVDFDLINGANPRGEGTFLFPKLAQVSEPVFITQTVRDQNGDVSYLAKKTLGPAVTLKLASVLKPVKIATNEYAIPEDSKFVPLEYGQGYKSSVESIDKLASNQDLMNRVEVVSDGTRFEFRGRPVDNLKLGPVDYKSGLLVLGALGDNSTGAKSKLASAVSGAKVELVAKRVLSVPISEVPLGDPEISKVVSLLRADLTKEASVLTGPDTVDSVLSLNFITEENVQGYIDSLPELEQAASKLAELLVGVRLGLSDIPEPAISASLRGIERAILGLKKLQMRLSFAGA